MGIFLFSIILIGLIAAAATLMSRKNKQMDEEIKMPEEGCCGAHEVCEKESLLAAASKTVEYFDDHELDIFKGREAKSYTESEIDIFSEIFYSLNPNEIPAWVRSLQLREIALPDDIKDEIILVVNDIRSKHNESSTNLPHA